MAYGTAVYQSNGTTPLVNQSLAGGTLYVATITQSSGTSQTYTYPDVPGGSNLIVLLIYAGGHDYTTGTNGSGQATVTFTWNSSKNGGYTYAYIFAKNTTEPNYGIAVINDAGERLVSTVFPVPEYLGKVTTTYQGVGSQGESIFSATTSIGSGTNRLILWSIPDTDYQYYSGGGYLPSSITGTTYVSCDYRVDIPSWYAAGSPAVNNTAPVAYIFGLDTLTASSDTYGIRVRNGSNIMFDSGKQHLSLLKAIPYTLDSFYGTGAESSFSATGISGKTTALMLPSLTFQGLLSSGPYPFQDPYGEWYSVYVDTIYHAGVRKKGNNFYSLFLPYNPNTGSDTPHDYYNGQDSGLYSIVTDATYYT